MRRRDINNNDVTFSREIKNRFLTSSEIYFAGTEPELQCSSAM
jgi:hypothetical protein